VQGQPLLISVLAGVPLDRLQRLFPGHCCVRAVPNTPALVGAGLTALAWGDGVNAEQRLRVHDLFADVGEVLELPESKLDAFLALTSSGPAFIALVAEAMADGAVLAGLPRDLAQRLAHRTLAGTGGTPGSTGVASRRTQRHGGFPWWHYHRWPSTVGASRLALCLDRGGDGGSGAQPSTGLMAQGRTSGQA
jgi:pyrroline-5-carboxylate reductase